MTTSALHARVLSACFGLGLVHTVTTAVSSHVRSLHRIRKMLSGCSHPPPLTFTIILPLVPLPSFLSLHYPSPFLNILLHFPNIPRRVCRVVKGHLMSQQPNLNPVIRIALSVRLIKCLGLYSERCCLLIFAVRPGTGSCLPLRSCSSVHSSFQQIPKCPFLSYRG